jgi:hypothetical protein
MNTCNRCKMAVYCNAVCKKKHKSKHKKKCDGRVAELHDEKLFRVPPPREDCPICFLPLPLQPDESSFKSCCGKIICDGCGYAMIIEDAKRGKKKEELGICAFCRTLIPSSDEERLNLLTNLIEKGNAMAYYQFGGDFAHGTNGMQQDWVKANELWLKAGDLGCVEGYYQLGVLYHNGMGVEIDKMKAKRYYELAAMKGNVYARHQLGCVEGQAGNYQRASKHMIIAARAGFTQSLDQVKKVFRNGDVTKDEYASTLRAYHERQSEMKSEARDIAAAIHSM